jgi:hypothetical protein
MRGNVGDGAVLDDPQRGADLISKALTDRFGPECKNAPR